MKNREAIEKVGEMLGVKKPKYHFLITKVKTFVDDGELEPIVHEGDIALYEEESLLELAKKVKDWIKRKKAGVVDAEGESNGVIYFTLDTPDTTIYATVYAHSKELGDVELTLEEMDLFRIKISPAKKT